MKQVHIISGRAVPLKRSDVDTDQIIPAEWLKRVERTGFEKGLFSSWRDDRNFVLNDERYAGASILVAGPSFGVGSSREHAVWALQQYGFDVVIAPSFSDIFRNNCAKNGLVPVVLDSQSVEELWATIEADPSTEITVDVERLMVEVPATGARYEFVLDASTQERFLQGLDDIGITLSHDAHISDFERRRPVWLSVTSGMYEPPLEFDAAVYRSLYLNLTDFTDDQLWLHYDAYGRRQGLRAHSLANRDEFARLAGSGRVLEIGPFTRPLLVGPNIVYADIYSTSQLQELAPRLELRPEDVPEIAYVITPGDLTGITGKFDSVISGQVIEHQPNLVGHLQQVSQLLDDGGRYFILAPDYRYCFDHFMRPSTISHVLDAYARKVTMHDPESLIASRLTRAHNDSVRHWAGDHGDPQVHPEFPQHDRITRLKLALEQSVLTPETLNNEHAWFFTPDSFAAIIQDLCDLELIDFELERIYPTLHNTLEFWAILRKPD